MNTTDSLANSAGAENQQSSGWFDKDVYRHDASLKAYLRDSFPKVRDLDDVVQESYLRIWKARAIQPIQSVKAFLFTVARRLALDVVRHQNRSPITEGTDVEQLFSGSPTAADAAMKAQEIDLLAEAVASLPPRCREVFVLRRFRGVSQRDIAVQLGLSEQTVQVQAARGLRKVEAFLKRRLHAKP